MLAQNFLIGMGEPDLTDGGRGLALFELLTLEIEPEMTAAERDRAGRNDDDFLTALAQGGDIFRQCLQPVAPERPGRRFDQ